MTSFQDNDYAESFYHACMQAMIGIGDQTLALISLQLANLSSGPYFVEAFMQYFYKPWT